MNWGGAERAQTNTARPRVWDIPTRLMHWGLVAGIAVCWWSGETNNLEYHLLSGYAVLWIVLMRIYWGFAGPSTARFSSFVRGPEAIFNYARTLSHRDSPPTHGHNPIGALSVLLLLGLVLAMVGYGLFAVDVDGLYSGPLSSYVSFRTGRRIARTHHWLFDYLLIAIALHLAAILFYQFYKRHNLVLPMITGRRMPDGRTESITSVPWWRFAIGAAVAALIVWAITTGLYF